MSERERNESGHDAGLVRLVRRWAPEPLDEAARARFDARLAERIATESRHRPGPLGRVAPAAAALGVAALAWWGLAGSPGRTPVPPQAEAPAPWDVVAWEWEVLLDVDSAGEAGSDEALPAEYVAIADAFGLP